MVEMWGSWSKSGGGRAAFSCSHRSGGPPYVLSVEGQELCGCWCWVGWTPRVHLRTEVGAQVIPGSLQGLSLYPATEGPGQSMDITPDTGMPSRVSGATRDGGCGMRLEEERTGALEGRWDRRMSLPRCIQALGATCLRLPRVLGFQHQVRGSLRAAQCQWCHLTPLAACPQRPQHIFSDHFPEVGQWCQGSRRLSRSIPGPSSEDPWVSWPSQRLLCPPAPSAGGQQQVCPVPE